MSRLHRLVYMSRPDPELGEADITAILLSARRRNLANRLTGFLAFNGSVFLQTLEGSAMAITETISRILADHRHQRSEIMGMEEIDQRRFADWGMGYAALSTRHEPLLYRYCGGGARLSTDSLTAAGAVGLLSELSAELSPAAPKMLDRRGTTTA